MSKLEPTRTYSNPTATDVLRRLLDERGVKWEDASPVPSMKPWKTSFTSFTGEEVSIGAYDEPKWLMGTMVFHTPEQAIAATLGSCNVGRYVGLCRGEYWERTENSDYYCGGCGWKVTDHDSYCPECGGALHKVVGSTTNDVDVEVDA